MQKHIPITLRVVRGLVFVQQILFEMELTAYTMMKMNENIDACIAIANIFVCA